MSDRGKRGPIVSHDRMKGKNFVKSAQVIRMVSSLKRKIRSEFKHASKPRKKAKTGSRSLATVNSLPWKTISHAGVFGNTHDDGVFELEEVDNVQVVYGETPKGRVATFKVCSPQRDTGACLK